MAQFRAMQQLPWYPQLESSGETFSGSTDVLDLIEDALQRGDYEQVIESLYPEAVKQGYQRNTKLYDNTRKALRAQLKAETKLGTDWWLKMQKLYEDRRQYLGDTNYSYRYTLETAGWNDEQLQNERISLLLTNASEYTACYDEVLAYVTKQEGRVDPVVVIQGMFAPQNRHDASQKISAPDQTNYQQILDWLEITETYMLLEHHEEYKTYYPQATLMAVREACSTIIGTSQAQAELAEMQNQQDETIQQNAVLHAQQSELTRAYLLAREAYQQRRYAVAWQLLTEADQALLEVKALKANILQSVGSQSTQTQHKLAYWCAAFEAGNGVMDSKQRQQLLTSIKTTLFMSPDLAGKRVAVHNPISITQRIWTQAQARAL